MENLFHLVVFCADAAARTNAENELAQMSSQPWFWQQLFQIIFSTTTDHAVCQSAAIYMKNHIHKNWDEVTPTLISIEDRNFIKTNILKAVVFSHPLIRSQITCCLGTILTVDFADRWPSFFTEVQALLNSGEVNSIFAGASAIGEVVKVFKWKSVEKRKPFIPVISQFFPLLASIAQSIVNQYSQNFSTVEENAAHILKDILKSYYGAIQYELPKLLQSDENVTLWCQIFTSVINIDIPENSLPGEMSARCQYPLWKAKKWAYWSLLKLFERYGNPSLSTFRDNKYLPFSKCFMERYASQILNSFLIQADKFVSARVWTPPKILFIQATFFSGCIKNKMTWSLLSQYLDMLVSRFIFPLLCFTEEDKELWEDDPAEFVIKKIDPIDDYQSPYNAAQHFLITLVRQRRKEALIPTLTFINQMINLPIQNEQDAYKRDGVLLAMASIAETLVSKKSNLVGEVGNFIVSHVIPLLDNTQFPFLRARACHVIGQFVIYDSDNTSQAKSSLLSDQNWCFIAEKIVKLTVSDPEVPVKIYGALCLKELIENTLISEKLKDNVPRLMEELIKMSNEIELEMMASVLERFVEVFSDILKPFAVSLCKELTTTILRILDPSFSIPDFFNLPADVCFTPPEINLEDEGPSSEKIMTCMGLMKTMYTLVMAMHNPDSKEELSNDAKYTLCELEKSFLPCVYAILGSQAIDLYEDVFDLIDSCAFQMKYVTPTLWTVFELLLYVAQDSAIDYIEEVFPVLTTFMTYGSSIFVQNLKIQQAFLSFMGQILKSEDILEEGKVCIFVLMQTAILYNLGQIDHLIEPLISLSLEMLKPEEVGTSFLVSCVEVVVSCIYYNPELALTILQKFDKLGPFLSLWFNSAEKFKRVHDKKISILAILRIIGLGCSRVPESLKSGWHLLLKSIILFFTDFDKVVAERKELEKIYSDEYENEFSNVDESGDEEYIDTESEQEINDIPQSNEGYDAENMDNEWDSEEDLEEDIFRETPLDSLDVYGIFKQEIESLASRDMESYRLLNDGLDMRDRELLSQIMNRPVTQ